MRGSVTRAIRRWKVAVEVGLVVLALVVVKLVLEVLSLEFIDLSPLFTSVVAGGIFVIGLIVAGTLADYKEAERMPAELTGALENIHEDGISLTESHANFDLDRLRRSLVEVVRSFRRDLGDSGSRDCLEAINGLSASILELEALDTPPNYIVRLRTEQGTLRRNVLRIYHIQRTEFLPSAYILIQTVVWLIVVAVEFTKIDPLYESIVLLVFISYFFLYLVRLLKILDTPFRVDEHTMDDVSLFLLKEFEERVAGQLDHQVMPRSASSDVPLEE